MQIFSMLVRDFRGIAQAVRAQQGMRQAGPQSVQVAAGSESTFVVTLPWGGYRFGCWLALLSVHYCSCSWHPPCCPRGTKVTSHWHQSLPVAGIGNKTQGWNSFWSRVSPGPAGHNPAVHICRKATLATPQLLTGSV